MLATMTGADRVTIIAYHAIHDAPSPVCLSPATFERQIEAFHQAGCSVLTMSEVARHISTGVRFPPRAIALTFDDGYETVHRIALPLLSSLGWGATVYPVTGQLGGENRWDSANGRLPRLPLVSTGQLEELVSAGWEVGGHTHTHAPLPGLQGGRLAWEMDTSTAVLEDLLGREVATFAYPYGRCDPASRRAAGARYGLCLGIGADRARLGGPVAELGRVDAWYLQRQWQLRHLHGRPGDVYLAARRLLRRVGQGLR